METVEKQFPDDLFSKELESAEKTCKKKLDQPESFFSACSLSKKVSEDYQVQLKQLKTELDKLLKTKDYYTNKLNKQKASIKRLETQKQVNDQLHQGRLNELTEKIESEKNQIASTNSQIETQKLAYESSVNYLKTKEAKLWDLNTDIKFQKQEINKLQQEESELTKELETQNSKMKKCVVVSKLRTATCSKCYLSIKERFKTQLIQAFQNEGRPSLAISVINTSKRQEDPFQSKSCNACNII